jgi:hypothetical protein
MIGKVIFVIDILAAVLLWGSVHVPYLSEFLAICLVIMAASCIFSD